jgi:hypothetical protein
MDSFIIAYIAQRMEALGFKKYSMDPILVNLYSVQTEYVIEGQNEYYYLVSKTVADQVEIFADNNYFASAGSYIEVNYSNIQEFTGQIRITFPSLSLTALEFIRVIPQLSTK